MSPSEPKLDPSLGTDTPEHAAAWRLLPWLANGTLADPELSQVLDHLKVCGVCRDELRFLPELRFLVEQAEIHTPEANADGEAASLSRLMERIEHHEAETSAPVQASVPEQAPRSVPTLRPLVEPTVRWWRRRAAARVGSGWGFPVVAAQALLLVLILGLVWTGGRASLVTTDPTGMAQPQFETLTQEPASPPRERATPRARLIFADGVAERQMRELLLELDATIVDGPNRVGAYTVSLPELDGAVLSELRQRDQVAFVEPVAGEAR